jgi:microcystin-dependent protein
MNQYLGEIRMFAGSFAPKGWQMCNGQLLSINQYSALFALLGTYYGGNGTSTFALPNLQSMAPVHWGTGPGLSTYVIGETAGTESVTMTQQQMPMHNHLMKGVVTAGADQGVPTNDYLSVIQDPNTGAYTNFYSDSATPDVTMNQNAISQVGANVPCPIVQPLLAVTFIIAMTGYFPSRN